MRRIYQIGLIGCGAISKNHIAAVAALPRARITAVCDKNPIALNMSAAECQCKGYEHYQDLLRDESVDIVTISTPSGLRARIAIEALKAGKHVLVEKPMALSLLEADAIARAATEVNKKVAVVHQNRFLPSVIKLQQAIAAGRLGRLTHGAAVVRWNRNETYYEAAKWRGTWAMDGGCLMNQAIHDIDLLQWMFGPAESVFGYAASQLRPIEAEDSAVAVIRFKNRAFATIEAATTIYPKNLEETLSVFGTEGSVILGGASINDIRTWRLSGEDEEAVIHTQQSEASRTKYLGHQQVIADFIEAIETECEPAISAVEGRKALEIILAIYHSVRQGQEVKLPLTESIQVGVGM